MYITARAITLINRILIITSINISKVKFKNMVQVYKDKDSQVRIDLNLLLVINVTLKL